MCSYRMCCILVAIVHCHFQLETADIDTPEKKGLPIYAPKIHASIAHNGQVAIAHVSKGYNVAQEVTLAMDRIFLVVKTSSDLRYQVRTQVILQTYLRFFSHPVLLSDASDFVFLDSVRGRIGDSATLHTGCPRGHDTKALCCKMSTALHMMKDQRGKRDWFCSTDDDQYIQADHLLASLDQLSPDEPVIYQVQCTTDMQPCGFYCMSRSAVDRFDAVSIGNCTNIDDLWLADKVKAFGIKHVTTPCLMCQYSVFGNGKRVLPLDVSISEPTSRRTLLQAVVFPWLDQHNDTRSSADSSALLRFHDERYPDCRVGDNLTPAHRRCPLKKVSKVLGECRLKWNEDICVFVNSGWYPTECKAREQLSEVAYANDFKHFRISPPINLSTV